MMIDFSPLVAALISLAAAMVSTAIPILVPALLRRISAANKADQSAIEANLSTKLERAANAAAGVAYQYAAAKGGLAKADVHAGAIAAGAAYVVESLPETLQALGVGPTNVASMVSARLGGLLAGDPTVTAGIPASASTFHIQPLPGQAPS